MPIPPKLANLSASLVKNLKLSGKSQQDIIKYLRGLGFVFILTEDFLFHFPGFEFNKKAVFNLLPIPALDGGRIVFVLLEMIRHKRLNPKIEGCINTACMLVLLALMVFVTFNDIIKLIF